MIHTNPHCFTPDSRGKNPTNIKNGFNWPTGNLFFQYKFRLHGHLHRRSSVNARTLSVSWSASASLCYQHPWCSPGFSRSEGTSQWSSVCWSGSCCWEECRWSARQCGSELSRVGRTKLNGRLTWGARTDLWGPCPGSGQSEWWPSPSRSCHCSHLFQVLMGEKNPACQNIFNWFLLKSDFNVYSYFCISSSAACRAQLPFLLCNKKADSVTFEYLHQLLLNPCQRTNNTFQSFLALRTVSYLFTAEQQITDDAASLLSVSSMEVIPINVYTVAQKRVAFILI